jgi:CRISPR/Cas system CMR-associated protein Cmr3 (group 5 of RAMP superfamily)
MQDMVRILHDNWPAIIEPYRLNNVIGLANPVSDQDVKVLRKKNVNTLVEIAPNIVYAPIGGDAASSGISVNVVRQSDLIKDQLDKMERAVAENIEEIAKKAREKGINLPEKPRFELKEQDGRLYAVEVHTKIGVLL